ncbi:MAG: hypothetical protein ACREAB_16680 [Blastocatellia bacterium]
MLFQKFKTNAFSLSLLLSLLITVCGGDARRQSPGPSDFNPKELHGGIEIAPRIIRSIALRISNGAEGENIKILNSDQLIPSTPFPKDEKLTPEYLRDLVQAIQKLWEKLQRDFRIPADQIYLLGLSEIAVQVRDDLAREILDKTGREITFLDAKSEIELSFAGNIPRRYQLDGKWYDNRNISLLLDIGDTNIRSGYQQLRLTSRGRTEYDYVTWEIPKGTTSLAIEANRVLGENADLQSFTKNLALNSNAFRGLVRTEFAQNAGLMTRKKIYLTGSILWAMTTLLYPEDQRSYVTLTMEDINNFHYRALSDPEALLNPDLSKIRDENARNEARKAREAVKAAYTPKTLIAGAEVLKVVASELNLADKRVIYARYGYLARILSYVRLQPD